MAAKKKTKKSTKKSIGKKKTGKRRRALMPPHPIFNPCNLPDLCKYVTAMSKFLLDPNTPGNFYDDYKRLRKAVCNVERKAYGEVNVNAKPPRFCNSGTGAEPLDPPTIPTFP